MTDGRGLRAALAGGALALAMTTVPDAGYAASEARQIAPSSGDAVRIVMPPRSGFRPAAPSHDAGRKALEVGALIALSERLERGSAKRHGADVAIDLRVGGGIAPVYFLPDCQRGLFGRAINRPCLTRPDSTILSLR